MSSVTSATSTTYSGDASEAVEKAESPPAHLQSPKIFIADPDGDLYLEVAPLKGVTYRFRVCSGTLRRHSPVWKTMLFGPWLESKPTNGEKWVVQLPEDPGYAMGVILYILHGRFDRLPQNISLQSLRGVLVLTNKYDMTSIVRPWCAQWIAVARGPKHLTNESLTSDGLLTNGIVRSLYVAWELGDEELFTQRLEDLSLRTRIDSEGRLSYTALGRNQKAVILNDQDYLGPQDALDTICAIREALLEKLITPVHEDLDARIKENPYCIIGYTSYTRILCDVVTIGGIHQHMLKTRGSILTKSASEIEDSVVELASWLFPMMSKIPAVHGRSLHSDHAPKWECSPAWKYKMLCSTIQDDIPTVVASFIKPNHREYMAAQRAKTGLVMEDEISMRRYWSWPSS